MWSAGRFQLHRLFNHRFARKNVVENSSSYIRSYLWSCRNAVCVDSTGCNGTEKDRVRMPPGLFLLLVFSESQITLFSINDLQFATLTHLNNEPVFTISFYREVSFSTLYKYSLYLYIYNIFVCLYLMYTYIFLSNYGQSSALKAAHIFKIFEAQSCLMVSYWFDKVTYAFEKSNNLLDSKSIFMICDFEFFPTMLPR